jgi:hypothetical protein
MPHRVSPNERIRATKSTSYSPRASSCRRSWKMSSGSARPTRQLRPRTVTVGQDGNTTQNVSPSPNITMNWNHARPFYTGFRTPP